MKTNFKILCLVVAMSFGQLCTAQEILTGFCHGERQASRYVDPEGRYLPFFDDFSHNP